MQIRRERIRTLLSYNREYIEVLRAGITAKLAAFFRGLYENLIRGPAWERRLERRIRRLVEEARTDEAIDELRGVVERLSDVIRWGKRSARGYASVLIFEWDIRREIDTLLAETFIRFPILKDEELLERVISIKKSEQEFLADLVVSFREVDLHAWAERALKFLKRVERWIEELLKMRPLWRVHKCHMWYRSYKLRYTPNPFAMVSVFTYTRTPEKYTQPFFDSALDFLETDPLAFPSFGLASVGVSVVAYRRGYTPPSAFWEVEGIEFERVDPDEVMPLRIKRWYCPLCGLTFPSEEEATPHKEHGVAQYIAYDDDQIRYYVAFYRIVNRVVKIHREYWGFLIYDPITMVWRIYPEFDVEETYPKWRKTEVLNWPDVLEI